MTVYDNYFFTIMGHNQKVYRVIGIQSLHPQLVHTIRHLVYLTCTQIHSMTVKISAKLRTSATLSIRLLQWGNSEDTF